MPRAEPIRGGASHVSSNLRNIAVKSEAAAGARFTLQS